MSYDEDIKRFSILVQGRTKEMLVGVAQECHESIVHGSPLTGAAGQPVDTGNLKNSWQVDVAPDFQSATIGTNVEYAVPIEDGIGPHGPLTLHSTVGGFHSVKTTVANADNIQRHVLAQVAR